MLRMTLAALAFLGAPALVQAETMPMHHAGHAKRNASPADKANAAAMDTMMKAMGAKPTGDPDRDFVTMMTPHHQGAIDMAKVELQYGKDPMLLDLAKGIVAAQEREIAEMKDWLAKKESRR